MTFCRVFLFVQLESSHIDKCLFYGSFSPSLGKSPPPQKKRPPFRKCAICHELKNTSERGYGGGVQICTRLKTSQYIINCWSTIDTTRFVLCYYEFMEKVLPSDLTLIKYNTHKPLRHSRKSFSFLPPLLKSLLDLHRRVSSYNLRSSAKFMALFDHLDMFYQS